MEQNKVDMFIASEGDKFPPEKLFLMRDQLLKLDESQLDAVQSVKYKKPTKILIFSIFLGLFGVDRFILGQIVIGFSKLLTVGWLSYGLIDWFFIKGATRKRNYKKYSEVLSGF